MSAQIIPFPNSDSVKERMGRVSEPATTQMPPLRHGTTRGLHIVLPMFATQSQQTALRIVEDVCLEHNLLHPVFESKPQRSANFWATLPIPPARTESPFQVAKRVAHIIFPAIELA